MACAPWFAEKLPSSSLVNQRVLQPATYPAQAMSRIIRTFCGLVTTALKWPV